MKKISFTDRSTIESVRLMTSLGNDIKPIIEGICSTHVLTEEFIQEFYFQLNDIIFSTSFRLTEEMANKHPDLFSDDIFKRYFIEGEVFKSEDNENPNPVDILTRADNIDISMAVRYIDDITQKYNKDNSKITEFLIKIIRNAPVEKLDISTCVSLMGFNNTIDNILLKRVSNEEIRNQILLTLSIDSDGENITSATYKYMSNDMKEETLGSENISFKEFIRVISQSNDIGWVSQMIERAVNNELEIVYSSDSNDQDMLVLINNLSEKQFVRLSKLSDKAPNAFSYKIMQWVLMNKYFNEQELIEMKDVFKRAGCVFQLKKLAKDSGYDTLFKSI